jgi:DUF1680 family protein
METIFLKTEGIADWAAQFLQKEQLCDRVLWAKFVDQFRLQPDAENHGWRGEYWGKMMRGGVLVYSYTRDEELYCILTESVRDMLTVAEPDGRVSTYARDEEFDAWDLWCRKYVILACEYYLDICRDEALKAEILRFICRAADYIIAHIGPNPGQKRITDATRSWLGLNSSSILEPMVRLYKLTGCQKYLDFSTYIIKEGGARGVPVFKLAFENSLYPYQYGVSKAYEMTSCFEGLLEYYYVTGNEACRQAVVNFAHAVMDSEISIIGCSGITHELFDYTRVRQTVRQEDVLQETCVTVTWMKFCSRLLELTGDPRFADCMEQSFYNAYLGTFNTERKICSYMRQKFWERYRIDDIVDTYLPIDSYSPLLSGTRGMKVGGNQLLSDKTYYGCCTCIAAAGIGVFMNHMVMADEDSITLQFFERGHADVCIRGQKVSLEIDTAYPLDGNVRVTVKTDKPLTFTLKLRVPGWTGSSEGYLEYRKEWTEDTVTVNFPMPIRTQLPEDWTEAVIYTDMTHMAPRSHTAGPMAVRHDPADDNYIALFRGPLTLAADSRSGKDADSVFDFEPAGTLCADAQIADGVPCQLKIKFTDRSGEDFYLVDYASAGRDWETMIAAWLRTK